MTSIYEQKKNKGAMGVGVPFHDETAPTLEDLDRKSSLHNERMKLEDLGISEIQSHRWQLACLNGYCAPVD